MTFKKVKGAFAWYIFEVPIPNVSGTENVSPLQLGKIGEKIYKDFIFWLKTPSASSKRKPKSSPR